METKERQFSGMTINGILMLIITIIVDLVGIVLLIYGFIRVDSGQPCAAEFIIAAVLIVGSFFLWGGFMLLEPGAARVLLFFGDYKGTFSKSGFYWVNPFLIAKKVSLRARNLDVEPIKVNDKEGNPVMIGLVLVWKLADAYKAMFEVDSQTMAKVDSGVEGLMSALERFVRVQSDAALRQVAGLYAYDDNNGEKTELTLRGGGEEINKQLVGQLDARLAMAGIQIVEARINYLAYAPEIAAVMLRRQQATAIISAREKIVEGAVSMVEMALNKLADDEVVDLDDEKKAAMVSNLLVVLCGDDTAQPVVNTGTLNH